MNTKVDYKEIWSSTGVFGFRGELNFCWLILSNIVDKNSAIWGWGEGGGRPVTPPDYIFRKRVVIEFRVNIGSVNCTLTHTFTSVAAVSAGTV